MKTMEFEGRTEREAVAHAAHELGIESFDVEILEKSGNLFSRSRVRIRVKPLTNIPDPIKGNIANAHPRKNAVRNTADEPSPQVDIPADSILQKLGEFAGGILERMGYPGKVAYWKQEEDTLIFQIESDNANIIIGKRGKNLDALQLLVNVYFSRLVDDRNGWHIVLDIENYRLRQKEMLIKEVQHLADEVLRTGSSRLLRSLNPFERRLAHMMISKWEKLATKSEGDGPYKRIRIMLNDSQRRNSHNTR